ncbi:MAG: HAMP domain-containing sensor histidine kinase [Saprospiraceae bacterium]
MNKRIIWLIIGVMSVALIGLVALQIGLILTSIRANEEAFDKNVQNTLSVVASRIEDASSKNDLLYIVNGYSVEYTDFNANTGQENGGMSIPMAAADTYDEESEKLLTKQAATIEGVADITIDYVNRHRPIEQRIDKKKLALFLAQELENNAIHTEYEYGVYSEERQAYVIYQGEYMLDKATPTVLSDVNLQNLENSPYSVTLFEGQSGKASGKIKIFFPDKTNVLWSALLPTFIGTFLFAALILACFGYTVWVIFKQKRLSEMKTDFINNMTHEFKTPIATISLAADSIANPRISSDVSKVLRFANIIKQENKRMNNQVEKVLQMAQIDKGQSKLNLTSVDLHEIIHQAVENIGLQVELRQGTVTTALEAENPVVEGDMTHLSNVINNLLDNANKYSPETPHIKVETRSRPDGVEVTVSDKGMGMTREARKHIFDKFYRVHTGDLHDVKGFGLGLSYVKAIMDAHKGIIDVKSEPGKGSDFILFFPRETPK